MKDLNFQTFWTSELRSQEGITVPMWIFVRIQQRDGQTSRNPENETIRNLPAINARRIFGTEIYPDARVFVNYDDDDCFQGLA